ncbi:MAG: hypothetical protein K9M02_16975 [Thiohalocapsa sp.]|nr:hypothetical protein [Thiohalocapsa sp.]
MSSTPEPRPRQILAAVARTYARNWPDVDRIRTMRVRDFPDWPDWCFLPLQAAHAIVGEGAEILPPDRLSHVGILGAMAAWRVTQGIYRFDPDVAAAVAETPLAGELPGELLYRLPEWCVYVETPGRTFGGRTLHGFWAHLDWEIDEAPNELRLLLDVARTPEEALDPQNGLLPVPLILGEGSIADALDRVAESARRQVQALGLTGGNVPQFSSTRHVTDVAPLVALVLYLCAENAEIGDGVRRPRNPSPKRTKRGERWFPAKRITAWPIGERLGAALRRAQTGEAAADAGEDTGSGGERSRPRPHIRRAHWHTYRVGERRVGRKVKWIAPVAVNVDDPQGLAATVRPVGKE